MAFQNIVRGTGNVAALALDSVTSKCPILWPDVHVYIHRMLSVPSEEHKMKGKTRKVFELAESGDFLKMPVGKSAESTMGRHDTQDVYSPVVEQTFGEARWPYRWYGGKIILDAEELARIGTKDRKGVFNYAKKKTTNAIESWAQVFAEDLDGYGYRNSCFLVAGASTGRQVIQGNAFMVDGPTGATGAAGNGNKDGQALTTSISAARGNFTNTLDEYYGGIDRDRTDAAKWRGISRFGASFTPTIFSNAHFRAVKGMRHPTLIRSGRTVHNLAYAAFDDNARFLLNGAGSWKFTTEIQELNGAEYMIDETMESTAFSPTAGAYFIDANVSGSGTNIIDLDDFITNGMIGINENETILEGLAEACESNGSPKRISPRASEVVTGLVTEFWYMVAYGGDPRFHYGIFDIT